MLTIIIFLSSLILLTGLLNDIKVIIKPYPILSITITTLLRILAALVIVCGGFIIIALFVFLTGNKPNKTT